MNLIFDLDNVQVTEFGVGLCNKSSYDFFQVPVDKNVQSVLHEMVVATWQAMQRSSSELKKYSPAEKHKSTEYLYLESINILCKKLVNLHECNNLVTNTSVVSDPSQISCYFVRLIDKSENRITAMRRASQFKANIKKKLIRLFQDSLEIAEDKFFRLDNDFDILIDAENIHIWRPTAFELLGGLQQAILDAVPENIETIKKHLTFVEFRSIEDYAKKHPRAAKYLASIREQKLSGITHATLEECCRKTNIKISINGNQIKIDEKNIMGFLEVLDRRRYQIDLVPNNPERFRASGREKLNK